MIWVNRHGRGSSRRAARSPTPRSRRCPRPRSCSAPPRRRRAGRLACTPTSSSRRARCGRRRAPRCARGGEAIVIDSPVLPGRARAAADADAAGAVRADGPAGHARRLGPPARPPRVPRRGARLRGDDGGPAAPPSPAPRSASCATFDDEHYVERPAPLSLGQVQTLPVPGHLEVGDAELELHPTEGHTADGMAIWIPWARRARLRRLPLAGRDPDDLREPARATPTSRRWGGWSRSSSRRRTSCRAMARVMEGAARGGDPARGRRVPRGAAGRHVAARAARSCSAAASTQRERGAYHSGRPCR